MHGWSSTIRIFGMVNPPCFYSPSLLKFSFKWRIYFLLHWIVLTLWVNGMSLSVYFSNVCFRKKATIQSPPLQFFLLFKTYLNGKRPIKGSYFVPSPSVPIYLPEFLQVGSSHSNFSKSPGNFLRLGPPTGN